jgi:stage II sporulation protein D
MWRLTALFLLCAQPALAVETMRIAMAHGRAEVVIEGVGLGFGNDVDDAPLTLLEEGRAKVRSVGGKLEIDGVSWPLDKVRFHTQDEAIRADGFRVRGDVVVRVHQGALELINVLPLEAYLGAVLGSEMPRSFPVEALKAQAVAARTYALHKKLEAPDRPWHLGSSVLHQVYGGLAQEDARTRAAVQATEGEVLTFELQPIEAYFHASCGGRTEDGAHALGRKLPYLSSVSCRCAELPASRWAASIPLSELNAALAIKEAGQLQVARRTRTGRATHLSAAGRSIDAVSFRRKLGYTRVKSLSFELAVEGDRVKFQGKGYGHGAGLCQWGAKAFADAGRDYRAILSHYYPGTELQHLY